MLCLFGSCETVRDSTGNIISREAVTHRSDNSHNCNSKRCDSHFFLTILKALDSVLLTKFMLYDLLWALDVPLCWCLQITLESLDFSRTFHSTLLHNFTLHLPKVAKFTSKLVCRASRRRETKTQRSPATLFAYYCCLGFNSFFSVAY
jgi:hypothetical protein